MSKIRDEIAKFISTLEKEHSLFSYICNDKKGGFDPGKDTVYYSGPYWDQEEKIVLLEAVLTGKWLSAGESVHRFENQFSEMFGLKYSVMVNSGSSANLIMITALKKYLEWEDGDEIILSPVGFPTTLAPVIQNGLVPIFVDISMHDLNFNVEKIEEKLTSRSKAILISPVLGNPPDMDRLVDIAERYGIKLVLDNCDSMGSRWNGRYLTDYSIASSCSFYPAHHITTGQGGMVSSNIKELIDLARSFSSWGGDCRCVGAANLLANGSCKKRFSKWIEKYDGVIDHRYFFTNIGYNFKPLDLQGAVGVAQLRKFEEIHSKRRQNKERIQAAFEKYIGGVRVLDEHELAETSWFGVGIVCERKELKEELVLHLERNRIQTRNYFAGNLLMHPAYEKFGNSDDYPHANTVLDTMFFVGCSPTITSEMIGYMEDVICGFRVGQREPVTRQHQMLAFECHSGRRGKDRETGEIETIHNIDGTIE